MKLNSTVVVLVASALFAVPLAAVAQGHGNQGATDSQKRAGVERTQRDSDRDGMRTRSRLDAAARDRDRMRQQIQSTDDAQQEQARVYGYGLMNDAERKAYRERVMTASSAEERERIEAQHRKEIQAKARERNIEIDDMGNPVPED